METERPRRENNEIEAKNDMEMNEELREDIERGRKAQIALEVLKEYLTNRRNEIVRLLEDGTYSMSKAETLSEVLAELRVIRAFWEDAEYNIQRGKYVEEELSRNGD